MTFHPASGYTYHPDHRAVGSAASAAVEQTGGEVRLVYVLAPRGVMGSLGGEPGAQVAANQPAPTYAMPIDRRDQAARLAHPRVPGRLRAAGVEGAAAPPLLLLR